MLSLMKSSHEKYDHEGHTFIRKVFYIIALFRQYIFICYFLWHAFTELENLTK